MMEDDFVWNVRAFVYAWFAEKAGAPGIHDIAERFDITPERAGQALIALHEKHALFLEAGTTRIRMANPFSAIATPFTVDVEGKTYWANCAWDCFGIAAALHASKAAIESTCAASGTQIHLSLTDGQVDRADAVVHFLVPFRHWYDDLVAT